MEEDYATGPIQEQDSAGEAVLVARELCPCEIIIFARQLLQNDAYRSAASSQIFYVLLPALLIRSYLHHPLD